MVNEALAWNCSENKKQDANVRTTAAAAAAAARPTRYDTKDTAPAVT